jgi:type IV secretory pathway VirJ component
VRHSPRSSTRSIRGYVSRLLCAATTIGFMAMATPATSWAGPAEQTHAATPQTISHGLFTNVQVYRPAGTPQQFVLYLQTETSAPHAEGRALIHHMVAQGAMVAVVPLNPFYKQLIQDSGPGQCTYPGGAFENLARFIQAYDHLPEYLLPVLVGVQPESAAFAYATLAQTPTGTFSGGLSVSFCPELNLNPPMCASGALRWQKLPTGKGVHLLPAPAVAAPWVALSGENTQCSTAQAQSFVQQISKATWMASSPASAATTPVEVAAAKAATREREKDKSRETPKEATRDEMPAGWDAAYARIAVRQVPLGPPPSQLSDLPLVEDLVPAGTAVAPHNEGRFAVFLSGDGGWATIDKAIASALVAKGVPVVGLDTLRYFWTERTPSGLASDLDRVIRYYAAHWQRNHVLLIGYSQGADVLPFAINRLPPATRNLIQIQALVGLGQKASFEFHLTNWMGPSGDKPIAPEARKLSAANTLCVYGTDEDDSLCPSLAPDHVTEVKMNGGHHFGGDYSLIGAKILEAAGR